MKLDLVTRLLLAGILVALSILIFERTPPRVMAQDNPPAAAPAEAAAAGPTAPDPALIAADRTGFSNVVAFPVPGADYDTRHLVLVATPHKIAIVAVGPLGFHGDIKVRAW